MDISNEIVEKIQGQREFAGQELVRLKAETKEAAHTESTWTELVNYLDKNWPFHTLDLLEKEAVRLSKTRAENVIHADDIEDIRSRAKAACDRVLSQYPRLFEQACRDAGLPLDMTSPHPKYTLDLGFITVEIDSNKRTARISNYEARLAVLPADVQAVVDVLKREHKRVVGRPIDNKRFLKKLRSQYTTILAKEKLRDGESVPIRNIAREFGKKSKGFRIDEFLVDLSRLAESGPYMIDGRKLDLQQTKDTHEGMLLYRNPARGYVGYIVFREA